MRILIRLPNWLGDVVMSAAFVHQLKTIYPDDVIDVIVKKELVDVVELFPGIRNIFPFSKKENAGIFGAYRFGKSISQKEKYDLFFCLPESFSSAWMGLATGSKKRIGFGKELRSLFLTCSYPQQKNIHRTEQYLFLLEKYYDKKIIPSEIKLKNPDSNISHLLDLNNGKKKIVLNFNSEADSRRMPAEKAVAITKALMDEIDADYVFIGTEGEKIFTDEIINRLENKEQIKNLSGKTSLKELAAVFQNANLVISTDSGPAHVANALETKTIVFFGAGDNAITSPVNKNHLTVIRSEAWCQRCVSNTCKLGPQICLTEMKEEVVINMAKKMLN